MVELESQPSLSSFPLQIMVEQRKIGDFTKIALATSLISNMLAEMPTFGANSKRKAKNVAYTSF